MEEDNAGWEKLLKTLHWLTLASDDAMLAGTTNLRSTSTELDAAAATELAANDESLCDSTRFSFTVPPAEAGDNGSFHLRVRFGVKNQMVWGQEWTWMDVENETQQDGWCNPLTHRDVREPSTVETSHSPANFTHRHLLICVNRVTFSRRSFGGPIWPSKWSLHQLY